MASHDRTNLCTGARHLSSPRALPQLQTKMARLLTWAALIFSPCFFPPVTFAAERLTICHGSAASALIPLAKLQGFFVAEDLDVELKYFDSGFNSVKAMQAGQCAMATAAIPPVVELNLQQNNFRIVAAISLSGSFEKLLVRRDRGIHTVADLRGKRIAVVEATSAHYFLDIFLLAHGLSLDSVRRVFLPPNEIAAAFRRGEVDAVAHWEPTIHLLAQEFGDRVEVFETKGLIASPFLLLASVDYLKQHPAGVESVLRALLQTEQFARYKPAQAKAQMAHYYNIESTQFDYIWSLHNFSITLDQPLLFSLENVARWRINQLPLAQRPSMPNYLSLIYLDKLKVLRPGTVTLIQ